MVRSIGGAVSAALPSSVSIRSVPPPGERIVAGCFGDVGGRLRLTGCRAAAAAERNRECSGEDCEVMEFHEWPAGVV